MGKPYQSSQVGKGTFTREDGRKARFPHDVFHGIRILKGEHAVGFAGPMHQDTTLQRFSRRKGWTLQEYIRQLDGEALRNMFTSPEEAAVETALPKFKGESSLELSDTLAGNGNAAGL